MEADDICCVWNNMFDSRSRLCEFNLTFFEKEGDGRYMRSEETQTERMYDAEEIAVALARSGFSKPEIYTDYSFTRYTGQKKAERMYYILKK